jgi:hypothetical protein
VVAQQQQNFVSEESELNFAENIPKNSNQILNLVGNNDIPEN